MTQTQTPLQLFQSCEPLAIDMAGKFWTTYRRYYAARGMDRPDVSQVALIGLWAAANKNDPNRGASFATFAHLKIREALINSLKRKLLPFQRFGDGEEFFIPTQAIGPADAVAAAEVSAIVRAAVAQLPDDSREILTARLRGEKTRDRIGHQKAKNRLKRLLADFADVV